MDVIHVEDEPVLRMLMAGLLSKRDDLRFHQFSGADEAFDFAASLTDPFTLLTDMNLPEPLGGRLIARVRGLPQGKDVHAVVLSASHDLEHIWELAPDADEVIEKPTSVARLKGVVDDVLERAFARIGPTLV